jgi:luciferase family oxidoreductase group 1
VTFRLSVLDQSPIAEGSTGGDALRRSIDLARRTEALRYHRYWVAEHHGTPMLACTSPEILIGAIAGATSTIRVGSGGVMLPHYSPLKVAEVFSMLSALYPERIDLALGRAAGTDPLTAFALQRDRRQAAPDDFPQQLAELLALLYDALPPGHRFARLAALPGRPERPSPWLLGSSPQSGLWAAEAGLPYAFADFINPTGAEVTRRYRSEFTPSEVGAAPQVVAAVSALCADTDEEAERLAASGRMAFALLHQGELIPVPPVDKAVKFLEERAAREPGGPPRRRRAIVGSSETVKRGIQAVAEEYGADEIMVVTITYDHEARCRSYELIADAFDLPSSGPSSGSGA